jgi:hypothetical protein
MMRNRVKEVVYLYAKSAGNVEDDSACDSPKWHYVFIKTGNLEI